jgi:hypothetical protein
MTEQTSVSLHEIDPNYSSGNVLRVTLQECFCCGAMNVRLLSTEKGGKICVPCDDYYAYGGPGEND